MWLAMVVVGSSVAALWGQPGPSVSPKVPTEDETLEMSPFTISTDRDTGYAATNSLAGTRLNSAIANIPAALSVMTREFLNDIGAFDATKAIEYSLNAANDTSDLTGNTANWNPYAYTIRGLGSVSVTRNYFVSSFLSDTYNADYLEMARGPNAVLFGIASPAGVYNTAIKPARPGQNLTEVSFRIGSFKTFRETLDVARTVGKGRTFAVRLNLLQENSEGYWEFEKRQRTAATLTATWRPFRTTTVRAEFEQARFFDARARPFAITDQYSAWVAAGKPYHTTPTARPAFTNSVAASTGTPGIVYFPESTVGPHPVAFSGNYFRLSAGTNVRGATLSQFTDITDQAIAPRTANLLGTNNGNTSDQTVAGLFVEQRVGRSLAFEAAFYLQRRDYLNRRPDGWNDNALFIDVSTQSPVFDPVTHAQTGYEANPNVDRYVARSSYQEGETFQRTENSRLTISYDLDFGRKAGWLKWLGHHQLAAMYQRSYSQGDNVTRGETNVAATRSAVDLTNAANLIVRANYIDFKKSDPRGRSLWNATEAPLSGPLYGTPAVNVQSGLVNIGWNGSKSGVSSAVLATQSSFFKGRLWFTGGLRHDSVVNKGSVAVRDPVTREYTGINYLNPYNPAVADTTNSFGAVYHVTSWLSVFGNRSDNFQVQANNTLFGDTGRNAFSPNTKGRGYDFGIRSALLGGKVNFSLGSYKTAQVGQFYSVLGTYSGVANAIWATLEPSHPLASGNDLQDLSGQGVEFELTANPTKNLRLTFNFFHVSRYGQTKPLASVNAYLEQYRATWLSSANGVRRMVNPAFGATVQDAWNFIQQTAATDTLTNGRMPLHFRPVGANTFARYQFSEGTLKGLAIGGGVNYRGAEVLAYANNDSKQQIRGFIQYYVNCLLSYERNFLGKPFRFQLNGDNLLNFDDRYPRNYFWFSAAQGGPSAYYQYPSLVRRYTLSTSVRL